MVDPKTYGLTHLAIAVRDINKTLAFYQQVFDMQVMYHLEGFLQLTTPGCNDVLVFEEKVDRPVGVSGGIAHFGFRLKNPADKEKEGAAEYFFISSVGWFSKKKFRKGIMSVN